jgi:NAD(P)-dependent dehydrogenase (short-subunit alcohol dehydrogenase family)
VNVSSGLSLTRDLVSQTSPSHFYPGIAYPASKAALNMITVQYAKAWPGIRINAVDPGFTATDLNHNTGTQTFEQSAEVIVRMAQISPDGHSGGFLDASGAIAW